MIEGTESETAKVSNSMSGSIPGTVRLSDLHGNTSDNIRPIPKTHIALPARWRVPRHDNQIQVDQDIDSKHPIPDPEARARKIETLSSAAYEDQPEGECQVENRGRVDLQVDDEVERIACRGGNDHDDCQEPYDEVRAEGCAEGAG
jgi:hypothetical protein